MDGNPPLAFELFQRFRARRPLDNIAFSLQSLTSTLTLALLGSSGETQAELRQLVNSNSLEDSHSRFRTLNAEFNRSDTPCILKVANRIYGEKTCTFLKEYVTDVKKYNADLLTVDFQNAADEARNQINQWVEEQTRGSAQSLVAINLTSKGKELLPEGTLNESTKLVLVNTFYFKGTWEQQFPVENTKDKDFRLNKNEKKTVKMMYMEKKLPFRHIPEYKCSVLELPYTGEDLIMTVLLPDEIEDNSTGLEQLEEVLSLANYNELTLPEKMTSSKVRVCIPKFKLEDTYDLQSVLEELGVHDVFDPEKADLSKMSGSRDLYLFKLAYKSVMEVNEEGAEAAAATDGIITTCCLPVKEFNANHPFVFFIRSKSTNTILVIGRVVSP